jgi:hypothetical protein
MSEGQTLSVLAEIREALRALAADVRALRQDVAGLAVDREAAELAARRRMFGEIIGRLKQRGILPADYDVQDGARRAEEDERRRAALGGGKVGEVGEVQGSVVEEASREGAKGAKDGEVTHA